MLDKETKKRLRELESTQALLQLLSKANVIDLSQRDTESISRAHRKVLVEPDCKIAYLGNHTIEPLDRFVDVVCLCQGISIASYIGEYNQYFQEILQLDSGCQAFQPDIIFLDLSLRVLSPEIYDGLLSQSGEQRQAEQVRILSHVSNWVALAKQQTDAVLVVSNFPRPASTQAGIADVKLGLGEAEFYHRLNLDLQKKFIDDTRVNIFDMDHVLSCAGKLKVQDPKLYYLAKMEWTEQALSVIAEMLLRYVIAILGRAKKCLVLDLDNTLWGGIVGEDGVDGLIFGEGSPAGEAYYDFQRYIRVLKERGIVLAICSKNNRHDVEDVFSNRGEMVLTLDDFSATKINWQHKHTNIQRLAGELNIGIDSMVFVDDNPVECELVRQMLPEVTTIELSCDPSLYVSQLKNLALFEKVAITDEDRQKTEQYAQNLQRADLKREINDINSFYESLGTEITISVADNKHKARIHQLFTKTNQFNLTTNRYSLSEVEQFIVENEWDLNITHVKDNFGDLGIVGLYLINKKDATPRIDSFILSCRAMGRGIEVSMMNKIKADYLMNGSFDKISAVFLPTAKNQPVTDFYETEGFDVVSEAKSAEKRYIIHKQYAQLHECAGIKFRSV
ncbi:MAG: HAD-IIIC family phosphatase [Gammaproteobacteria bacterium]|nr:HAD-IIIC family phosphatase [Gammaproteobacteria bacterium]